MWSKWWVKSGTARRKDFTSWYNGSQQSSTHTSPQKLLNQVASVQLCRSCWTVFQTPKTKHKTKRRCKHKLLKTQNNKKLQFPHQWMVVFPRTQLIKSNQTHPAQTVIHFKQSFFFPFHPTLWHFVSFCPPRSVSLVLGDHHHHANSKQQGQNLHYGLAETGAAHQQFWEHGHCGDVNEPAGGERQDPGGRCSAHALGQ